MIDLIFHIINFAVFVALCMYAFKKYAYFPLRQEMITEELAQSSLHKKLESLKKQEAHLAAARQHQKALYEELLLKTERWRVGTAARTAERKIKMQQLVQDIQDRVCVQKQYQERMQVEAVILPRALAGAQAELMQKYAEPEAGQKYTNTITDALQARVRP